MADALRERTARLLTDYLEYCAREPGTPARAPSTPEAAVLRSVAAQVRQRHERFLSHYRGYQGNRVELVAQVEREILAHPQLLSWGRVVALLTFAGTLLEGSPSGTDQEQEPGDWEATVRQDCGRLVDFLCNRLTGQHRAWLEAHDGWDGFCLFFTPMLPLEKNAGPGSSVMLYSSDLNLLLEKVIVSSEIFNAFLPA
ncbi:LOW QUALITY PROTEIN: bcl-2-like protein 10 [Leptonychotes weddellii]|uniref:Bcl-2-like protein 10 n=1 Tax=Leptonychotes weddellii TaxID=9713 RepID=A0A7F8QT25_LEPWE|nr:LOW QUALITY PROTEIN: bcl-2-like protein 10 [Leptonychotes weddellii]